jgi:hypothetical protein
LGKKEGISFSERRDDEIRKGEDFGGKKKGGEARFCEAVEERGSDDYGKDRIYGKDGEHVTAKLACYYVPVHVEVSAETLDLGGKSNGGGGHRKPGRQDGKSHLSWCILIFPKRINLPRQCHISDGCKKW